MLIKQHINKCITWCNHIHENQLFSSIAKFIHTHQLTLIKFRNLFHKDNDAWECFHTILSCLYCVRHLDSRDIVLIKIIINRLQSSQGVQRGCVSGIILKKKHRLVLQSPLNGISIKVFCHPLIKQVRLFKHLDKNTVKYWTFHSGHHNISRSFSILTILDLSYKIQQWGLDGAL